MSSGVMKMVTPCWKPYVDGERGSRKGRDDNGRVDGLLWYKDLGCHVNGEFSMAVIQANNLLEDQSQVESGPLTESSRVLMELLLGSMMGMEDRRLREFTSESRQVSADAIRKAFLATEEEFLSVVKKQWLMKPQIASVGSCCLVSRSIGDAYLKRSEFNREPLLAKFRLPEPFHKPILSPDPSISVQKILPHDQFLIFASDGLWEHLSNQDAVDIVHQYPRNGIARRLVKAALREAAKKREMRYSDLKKIDRGVRRHFHDDITVVVLFLDTAAISKSSSSSSLPAVSIKGGGVSTTAGL
ncbi:hypothetical protein Syun_016009 [Stephania yunnanensis]|uniref:PPM-type phosphatase domain-containing protein n=1 Tax=Stephania yunnanensis TaxID=152371 RepID=A0AAP0J407_9MAGN